MASQEREKALKELVLRLKGKYGDRIVKIILFGSYARGDCTLESDIDLLVVLDERTLDIEREIVDLTFEFLMEYGVDISPKVYSISEYEQGISIGTPFMRNIQREGKVLV